MTTTAITDERTAVVTDLPDTQPPVRDPRNSERWFLPTEISIHYVSTRTDTEESEAAVSVDVYGYRLDKPGAPGKRHSPLVTYTEDFPDWVAEYVERYNPDKTD